MSIASEITRIQNAKENLKTSINAKTDAQHKITNETIDDYADFVDSISEGITPTGTLNITEDGTYDVTNYAQVVVDTAPHSYLDYIQATGTQYITTDFVPNNNTRYILEMSDAVFKGNFAAYFAANTSFAASNIILNEQVDEGQKAWLYKTSAVIVETAQPQAKHIYELYRGTVIEDGVTISSNTSINSNVSFGYLTFFSDNSLGRTTEYKLHEFKCIDETTGNIVRLYKPVMKKDGTICLYEEMGKKYFYNNGTGDFIGG